VDVRVVTVFTVTTSLCYINPQFDFAPVFVGCLVLAFAVLSLFVGALLPRGP
jgi:hypothetical protein